MRKALRDPHELREMVLLSLGTLVFLTWCVYIMVCVALNRQMDAGVHTIMGIVASGLYGGAYFAGKRNGKNGA